VFTLSLEVRGSRYHYPVHLLNMALAGFIAGLIIPHKNGFAISLTEKLEDFVILLLIPIVRPSYRPV
jgi:Kef-type K+ transport system membrane component KefB